MTPHTRWVHASDAGERTPVDRRDGDRRRVAVGVPFERRTGDRRMASRMAPPGQAADLRGTAVVIDEWPLVRAGVAQVLQEHGIRLVGEAEAAAEGLHLARTERASILIVGTPGDCSLIEVIRSVRQGPRGPRVIALLTRTPSSELRELLTLETDALLLRSVGQSELGAAVGRVLAGERVVTGPLLSLLAGAPSPTPAVDADGGGGLTSKERLVLARLAQGSSNKEIASALHVSAATVKTHLSHIYAKLDASGRHDALARAMELGLLT